MYLWWGKINPFWLKTLFSLKHFSDCCKLKTLSLGYHKSHPLSFWKIGQMCSQTRAPQGRVGLGSYKTCEGAPLWGSSPGTLKRCGAEALWFSVCSHSETSASPLCLSLWNLPAGQTSRFFYSGTLLLWWELLMLGGERTCNLLLPPEEGKPRQSPGCQFWRGHSALELLRSG